MVDLKIELLIESAASLQCSSLYREIRALCWEIQTDDIFCHLGVCFTFFSWTFLLWPPPQPKSQTPSLIDFSTTYSQHCPFLSIFSDISFANLNNCIWEYLSLLSETVVCPMGAGIVYFVYWHNFWHLVSTQWVFTGLVNKWVTITETYI